MGSLFIPTPEVSHSNQLDLVISYKQSPISVSGSNNLLLSVSCSNLNIKSQDDNFRSVFYCLQSPIWLGSFYEMICFLSYEFGLQNLQPWTIL